MMRFIGALVLTLSPVIAGADTDLFKGTRAFLENHCFDCHDEEIKKGGLDLTALTLPSNDPQAFLRWVQVHDRVSKGEMPPKKQPRPGTEELANFAGELTKALTGIEAEQDKRVGRSVQRRLNRNE